MNTPVDQDTVLCGTDQDTHDEDALTNRTSFPHFNSHFFRN